MSQTNYTISCGIDGTALKTKLNVIFDAIDSMHSSSAEPTNNLHDGKLWLDTTTATNYIVKVRRGSAWEELFSYNNTNSEWEFVNAKTATKLRSARALAFTGDVTGTGNFDGSTDVSTAMTISPTSVTNAQLAGSITDGKLSSGSVLVKNNQDNTFANDQTFAAITETVVSKTTSFTPNLSTEGNIFKTSTAVTMTIPSAESGKSFTVIDTDVSLSITGTVKWFGGSAPNRGTSGTDIYTFFSDGTDWFGSQVGNYS